MRRGLVAFAACCAGVLALVAVMNATVDPAGLFARRDRAKAAARLLLAGEAIPLGNIDDRRLHASYARLSAAAPDIAILGSSRVMELGDEIAPTMRVYNAATGSNSLNDTIALAGLFATDAKKPRVVIIGADPWLLDREQSNGRWRTLHAAYRDMARRLGIAHEADADALDETWPTLLSLGYTLESIDWIKGNWRGLLGPADAADLTPATDDAQGLKRSDGSLVYPASFRRRGADEIRAAALAHGRKHVTDLLQGGQLDPTAIDRFERLVRYLRSAGVQVVLLLAPYHPLHYAHVAAHGPGDTLARIEATYRAIAGRTDARLAGAFDPARAGCAEGEFWDGMHARKACLDRLVAPVLAPIIAALAGTDER